MAKKNSKSEKAAPKPAANSAAKPTAKPVDKRAAAAEKSPAAAGPAMSNEAIGSAAGDIWQALSANGGLTLPALKKSVDAPADVVLAAVGWLAREDKLEFVATGKTFRVTLR